MQIADTKSARGKISEEKPFVFYCRLSCVDFQVKEGLERATGDSERQ